MHQSKRALGPFTNIDWCGVTVAGHEDDVERPTRRDRIKELAMLKLYYHPTPNSTKVVLLLEELQAPYEVIPIDIQKGEQHAPAFLQVNPNGKLPAIDDDGVVVFDSHAILIHLAETRRRYLPSERAARARTFSWLELVATGLSPFSGQAVHFLHYAPEEILYARNRYLREVERHYRVLDGRLQRSRFLAGDEYTIADIALFGWAASSSLVFGEKGLGDFPNVQRLMNELNERPAVDRAVALKGRHAFKTDLDEEARRALFPQNFAA